MNILKYLDIKSLVKQFKSEGLSMRRRFAFYVFSVICLFLAVIIILLNLFGILNPTDRQIMNELNARLSACSERIERDCDELAACAISFSGQLERSIQNYLTENHISFDELKNNSDALDALQNRLYDSVYLNMQVAPASGAFYILDTTVNSSSDVPLYNGIYLKYINLSSENTVNNDFSIYRGSFSTGKSKGINFHSGWKNESSTTFFENCNDVFSDGTHYLLSTAVEIPDTWERARYIYVPIRDYNDNIIGVCGFEITDLLFQLSHKTINGQWGNEICGLLDEHNGIYSGQFSSGRYNNTDNDLIIKDSNGSRIFDFDNEKCVGLTKEIILGNETFSTAVMLPKTQYDSFLRKGQMNIMLIFLIIAILAAVCCVLMSKKYVSPILKKIEQVKANENFGEQLRIREIDDLFAFLEEKDNYYEQQLDALENAKNFAEEEARKAKEEYEKAAEKYELAKSEIDRLAEKHKEEIVPEEYNFFVENLSMLTPAEYRVYELYLSGKTAKQIAEILHITENTLKYHNKNIYSKLGISSRKQLLRFAALKQHRDGKENWT
ncbi:MAG: helix-turn-helix transcriptional regulator [Oscillospiraceae bacterium]|nr:helix-turn-helix transcriptional regulator [Oscillospiraceae bacterium]